MHLFTICLKFAAVIALFLSLTSCKQTWSGRPSGATQPSTLNDKPAVLATIDAAGTEYSDQRVNSPATIPFYYVDKVEFSENGSSVAATLLLGKDQWQVSFNGRPGPVYPSVGPVSISPDGRRFAYKAMVGPYWCLVEDGVQTTLCHDDITSATYSVDSKHLIVEYVQQGMHFLKVDNHVTQGSSSFYRTPTFYDGFARLIFIDSIAKKDSGRLVVCNADLGAMQPIAVNINDFFVSSDKKRMAAIEIVESGKSRILLYNLQSLSDMFKGPEFDHISFLKFSQSGEDLFYFGKRGKVFYGVFNGLEEQLPEGIEPVRVTINRPDKSVGVLVGKGRSVFLYRMFRASGRQSAEEFDDAESLTYSADGTQVAFVARNGDSQFVVVNNGKGPAFDRVVSPSFSPDGKCLVYRARKAGKRFVVVADRSGKTIRQHPAYDHVNEVKFTKDGKSVAYGVKDGRTLAWKVEPL